MMFARCHYPLAAALLLVFAIFFLSACEDHVPTPKPHDYPRVIYPEKKYKPFDEHYCAFTFDQPVYATVEQDTSFFGERPESDCWFNLSVPALNAKIYCSYYPVTNRGRFDELVQDAHAITQKHNIKASYIDNIPVYRDADHVHGVVFNVEGPAASSYQFFLTDSTRHFLRGALYFNTQSRPDSLAPVIEFMKQDLDRLVSSLKWQ